MASDWQSIKNRTSSSKTGSYVPPHMRGAAAVAAKAAPKELNLSNAESFPTLGTSQSAPVAPVMNFKQTIKDLISYEQRSEEEKAYEAELLRQKNGFACLKLNLGPSDYLRMNENIRLAVEREKQSEMFGESSHKYYKKQAIMMDELAEEDTYVVLDPETPDNFEPLPECVDEIEMMSDDNHRIGSRRR